MVICCVLREGAKKGYMQKGGFLLGFLFFFGFAGKAQINDIGVLDGVYVKEHIPTKKTHHTSVVLIEPNLADSHQTIWNYLASLKNQPAAKLSGLTYINYVSKKANENVKLNRETFIETVMNAEIEDAWVQNKNDHQTHKVYYNTEFLKYYVDASTIKTDSTFYDVTCRTLPLTENIFKPFYFKNTEVTNLEYRQFYYYVRDSIARRILGDNAVVPEDWLIQISDFGEDQAEYRIDWNQPLRWNDEKIKPLLEELYYPENPRYYTRKEIDKSKMVYVYYENRIKRKIPIYPDTLNWTGNCFNNPKVIMYFWHPAYDHYPVVNVSYNQAKAFLHWKTMMYNQELNRKKAKYRVEFDLPNAIEWYIANMQSKNVHRPIFMETANQHMAQTWKNDLFFQTSEVIYMDTVTNGNYAVDYIGVKETIGAPEEDMVNALVQSNLYKVTTAKKPSEKIISLHNNVSEWLNNDLTGFMKLCQYKNHLITMLEKKSGKDLSPFKINLPNVPADSLRMVKGSNWFNEQNETTGVYKKAYVHQKTQSPFIGFRYVVHITEIK